MCLLHIGQSSTLDAQAWQQAMWPQGTSTTCALAAMQMTHSPGWPEGGGQEAGGGVAGVGQVAGGGGLEDGEVAEICEDVPDKRRWW